MIDFSRPPTLIEFATLLTALAAAVIAAIALRVGRKQLARTEDIATVQAIVSIDSLLNTFEMLRRTINRGGLADAKGDRVELRRYLAALERLNINDRKTSDPTKDS